MAKIILLEGFNSEFLMECSPRLSDLTDRGRGLTVYFHLLGGEVLLVLDCCHLTRDADFVRRGFSPLWLVAALFFRFFMLFFLCLCVFGT